MHNHPLAQHCTPQEAVAIIQELHHQYAMSSMEQPNPQAAAHLHFLYNLLLYYQELCILEPQNATQ